MKIRITSVDFAPDELYDQTPFDADLLREFPGPDRSDYWIGALTNPIRWVRNGVETFVSYVVLASRYEGTRISAGMKSFIVGIAYVVDESVLEDPALTFEKCEYVAIGSTDDISDAA
jgi:hypothetical protein